MVYNDEKESKSFVWLEDKAIISSPRYTARLWPDYGYEKPRSTLFLFQTFDDPKESSGIRVAATRANCCPINGTSQLPWKLGQPISSNISKNFDLCGREKAVNAFKVSNARNI